MLGSWSIYLLVGAYEVGPEVVVEVCVFVLSRFSDLWLSGRSHAAYAVEVTLTTDIEVAVLIERNEEQKGVALWTFKTSIITSTFEHSAGVRLRGLSSWIGEA